jgi:hypothetical protein
MPKLRRYGLFVSHAWKYGEEYARFSSMLFRVRLFSFVDYSASRDHPVDATTERGIAAALKRQIEPTDVMIVLAGMYVSHRDWMLREINLAQRLGKPIVGVHPYGSLRMPRAVSDVADEIVGWRGTSVAHAVRRLSR